MAKIKTSESICTDVKAQILLDILNFMLNKKRDLSSDVCEIYKTSNGWNVLEVKTKIAGLRIPDIPYMNILSLDEKFRWKFKFELEHPHDSTDSSIMERSDLKEGEKVLLLALTNMVTSEDVKYWDIILNGIPSEITKDLLRKLN